MDNKHKDVPHIVVGVEMEPRVQFKFDMTGRERVPDAIRLPDGSIVVLSGRYASPGERYCYKRVREIVDAESVSEWTPYTELKGSADKREPCPRCGLFNDHRYPCV